MSSGLRVWNSAGTVVLNITDRLTRHHSSVSYTLPPHGVVTIWIPGYSLDGTWFYTSAHSGIFDHVTFASVDGGVRVTSFNGFDTLSGTLSILRV